VGLVRGRVMIDHLVRKRRYRRTREYKDLGLTQKEILGDMYKADQEWTVGEVAEWLGITTVAARKSMLLLWRRKLLRRRPCVRKLYLPGLGRPNYYKLSRLGIRIVEEQGLHLKRKR